MSELEKLARDICWAEFSGAYKPKGGKAAYWRGVHPKAKADYLTDARRMVWIAKKLDLVRLWSVNGIPTPPGQ